MTSTLKKALALLMTLCMVFALAACASDPVEPEGPTDSTEDGAALIEKVSLKIGGSGINNHTDYMLKELEKLLEDSGMFEVDYFPNLQLGSIREYYESCQQGQIQMAEGGLVIMANFTKKLDFMYLPMLFDSREAVMAFCATEVGQELLTDVAEETNLYPIIMAENGFQVVSNNKREIHLPEDMKGLKIRTQENPILLQIYSTLGADPTPLAYSELFTALQQGTVDGQVNPAVVMATTPIAEVQEYVSDTNLMYDVISVCVNYDWYKSLTAEQKAVFDEACNKAWQAELDYCSKDYMGQLAEQGMTATILTDEERAAFKTAVEPVYDWFRENYDSSELDSYLEAIAEANASVK